MGTTVNTFRHDKMLGGMNITTRPDLLNETQWRTQFNMRTMNTEVRQVEEKIVWYYAGMRHDTILEMVNLPAGHLDYGTVLALTEDELLRIDPYQAEVIETGLTRAAGYRRWGTCVHNGYLLYCNELNPVRYTDGVTVTNLANAPSGKYVDVYYDHVVVGQPLFKGEHLVNGIRWSHLYDWNNWTPDTDSEADFYICSSVQRGWDATTGVTGLRKLGDMLLTYTPNGIYATRYVGLPRVMRTDPFISDVGNGLPWGLASTRNAHFFYDLNEENFFMLTTEGLRPIGDPIKSYVLADVNADFELAQRTWAYVDQRKSEITWVYVSRNSTGAFDRAVVYNYESNLWYARSVENLHSFVQAGRRARRIEEIQTQVGSLEGQCGSLVESGDTMGRLWGGGNTAILREAAATDETSSVLWMPDPQLETGDYIFDNIQRVKDVGSIAVDSAWDEACGVRVSVSARQRLTEAVSYVDKGFWRPGLYEQKLTFKHEAGKILRYRFNPEPETLHPTTVLVYNGEIADFSLEGIFGLGEGKTIGGTPGQTYNLRVRIRGAVELKRYINGEKVVGHPRVRKGGTTDPRDAGISEATLGVSSPSALYYLNAVDEPVAAGLYPIDLTLDIVVDSGATVSVDLAAPTVLTTDAGGGTPEVPWFSFTQQIVKADFVNELTEDVNEVRGALVRGFTWATFEDNVQGFGGEK